MSNETLTGENYNYKLKELKELPAIGLVATDQNSGDIARSVLRATEQGYRVFVTYDDTPNKEAVRFANKLGADVVTPSVGNSDRDDLRDALKTTSQSLSFPGLIIHTGTGRIDFDRSRSMFKEGGYCVDAITESEQEFENETSTLAAVPAYNEVDTIGQVVADANDQADAVLVVDDGSDDRTAERAREAGATVVEHDVNSGYGAALKTTFVEAHRRNVDHLVILDGDGQHDASDIPKLVATQEESDVDIVIGSRFAKGSETEMPLYRRFGLAVVNGLTNLSMGVVRKRSRVQDTQSGFRAYNEQAIESLATDSSIGDHMNASTDILYHAHQHDYEIEEVGTTINYDVEDASSHNPVSHGFVLVSNILKTVERDRPITSLGVPGFVSAFAGLGFGYWTFSNYISTGTFPMSLAITSAFFTLAGIFSCFTAIILHSLSRQLYND
ncbi:glycosyltransferase family 2 protein [Haladaptatus sp. T7]|uniref:glycosyltransferase family 2 protein n=1 Tax=Haladaptatus sp. T7 TaxID=2029368 RepID=UPI0021A2526D|nr:glycosyltransferase family 2 protein [Haladaptatus sp. T7]GKZ14543.1 hypothetical protein HAL_24240 [Haladaptatus sp. T7]